PAETVRVFTDSLTCRSRRLLAKPVERLILPSLHQAPARIVGELGERELVGPELHTRFNLHGAVRARCIAPAARALVGAQEAVRRLLPTQLAARPLREILRHQAAEQIRVEMGVAPAPRVGE